MKTRASWVAVAGALLVGMVALAYTPAPPPVSAPMIDSAHWASLLNSITDPTQGLVSRNEARGDSLLRHPGALGWGAASLTCQDSLRAGSGTIKVWKVTASSGSGAGTFRAAMDSVDAYDNAATCQYIIWPNGGNFAFDETGSPNYDGSVNWRWFGQTAQGGGANLSTGEPRYRTAKGYGAEYLFSYRPGTDRHSPWSVVGDGMNTQKGYFRHISIGLGGGSGGVQFALFSGTEVVPQWADTSKQHTIEALMLGEPGADRPLHMVAAAAIEEANRKNHQVTVRRIYFHGSGWRAPNLGDMQAGQFLQSVGYNATNYMAGNGLEFDIIDWYARPGPTTPAGGVVGSERRWPYSLLAVDSSRTSTDSSCVDCYGTVVADTISYYMSGIRGEQNDYAVGMDSIDLLRGATRVVACDADFSWFSNWCQVDGDSIPVDPGDTPSGRVYARWSPLPLAQRAPSADADPLPTEPFTDTVVAEVIRLSGNVRYLQCTGEWAFRTDSIKTRWMQEWVDSSAAGDHAAAGGVVNGTRTYGAPAAGTACSDTDGDGLPNAYEYLQVTDSTALAVDSMNYGRAAIEWYLDGRHIDGTLVGCEGLGCAAETAGVANDPTFGEVNRYVYLTAAVDTLGRIQPVWPYSALMYRVYWRWNQWDSAMVVTCSDVGAPLDSAAVQAKLTAWSLPFTTTAVQVRDEALGGPC